MTTSSAATQAPSTATSSSFSSSKPSGFVAAGAVTAATVGTAHAVTGNDAKIAQNTATSGKTYATKADADAAYRAKLAKTTYNTATAPATRPTYIPQRVHVGSSDVDVVYSRRSDGSYGYGYYDPTTHMFLTLAATQMVINAQHQAEIDRMYATPTVVSRPAVVTQTTNSGETSPLTVVLIVLGLVVFLVGVIVLFVIFSKGSN